MSSLENGLDMIRAEKPYRRYISYDYLNERGLDEVDILVSAVVAVNQATAAAGKEDEEGEEASVQIASVQMITQLAGLLLLYLAPAEAYCAVQELVKSSREQLASEEMKNAIRWHLPLGQEDCSRMHQAFCYSYLMTTLRKKRSLAEHMKQVGFDLKDYA
jgi:hypothetical protein